MQLSNEEVLEELVLVVWEWREVIGRKSLPPLHEFVVSLAETYYSTLEAITLGLPFSRDELYGLLAAMKILQGAS